MKTALRVLLIFLIALSSLFLAKSSSFAVYVDPDGNNVYSGSGGSFYCDPYSGLCTCEDAEVIVSDLEPCRNNLGSYSNICCTSPGGCSASDATPLNLWEFNYVTGCKARGRPFLGECKFTYTYQTQSCGARDSCMSGSGPYLSAGACNPQATGETTYKGSEACVVGGQYKVCCNQDGTGASCLGGQFSGACPSGSKTIVCGVDQTTCDAILRDFSDQVSCTTAPCSTDICKPPPTPVCTPSTNSFTQCCGNNLAQNVSVTSYSGGYNCPSQKVTTGECNIQDSTRCGSDKNKYWFCNPNTGSCQETTSTYSDKSSCQSSIQQYWGVSTSCYLKSSDVRLDEYSQCQKSCVCKAGEYKCSTTTNACMVN